MGSIISLYFSSGVVVDETVNVDTAKEIAESILKSMENKSVEDFIFKKKSQAATLTCKTQVQIDNDSVAVDPQLRFQRLISYSVL